MFLPKVSDANKNDKINEIPNEDEVQLEKEVQEAEEILQRNEAEIKWEEEEIERLKKLRAKSAKKNADIAILIIKKEMTKMDEELKSLSV